MLCLCCVCGSVGLCLHARVRFCVLMLTSPLLVLVYLALQVVAKGFLGRKTGKGLHIFPKVGGLWCGVMYFFFLVVISSSTWPTPFHPNQITETNSRTLLLVPPPPPSCCRAGQGQEDSEPRGCGHD